MQTISTIVSRSSLESGGLMQVFGRPSAGDELAIEFPNNSRKRGVVQEVSAQTLIVLIDGALFELRPWLEGDDQKTSSKLQSSDWTLV